MQRPAACLQLPPPSPPAVAQARAVLRQEVTAQAQRLGALSGVVQGRQLQGSAAVAAALGDAQRAREVALAAVRERSELGQLRRAAERLLAA